MNARNAVKLPKGLLTTAFVGICWEKEREYVKLRQPRRLDKEKQHILMGKYEQTQNLNFFPGLNMLVPWVTYMLRLPFGAPPKLGLVNMSPYISMAGVQSYTFTLSRLAVNSQKAQIVSSLLPVVSGTETSASTGSVHVHKISNPPGFFLVIFNYHKCFHPAIWRLSALFIYSLLSHSITLQNKLELIFLHTVKWFQELQTLIILFNINHCWHS